MDPNALTTAVPSLVAGRCQVFEKLVEDWKGQTFRCRLAGRETDGAVLRVADQLASGEDFTERFAQAASTLPQLSHPGLVRYLEFLRHEGGWYIATELLEADTLRQWLAQRVPPVHLVLEGLCAVLDGLEHAHGRGVYHLDLTSDQLLMTCDGRMVLTDLGLASLMGVTGRAARFGDLRMARALWPYLAPEAQDDPLRADFRADIYSMGVICYEALTGRMPVGVFDMPSKVAPALDPKIDPVIATALTADPARRYQRASELATALRHAAGAGRYSVPAASFDTSGAARVSAAGPSAPAPERLAGPQDLATLTLDSDPPAARVTDLSGAAYGDTPLVLKLPPGGYAFCFRLPDPYVPLTEEVRLIAGSSARVVARPVKRSGEIVVSSVPPGAEVWRDGQCLGATPLAFAVSEGETGELSVRKPGYHEAPLHFEGRSAQKSELRALLKPRMAVLEVVSDPVGTDILDEKLVRISTAPARVHLDAGKRRLTFRSGRGFEERSEEVELAPGEERKLEVKLVPRPGLVEVTSVPTGARVSRDGQPVGTTSMTLTLPGRSQVMLTLSLPGYKDQMLQVTAEGGGRTVVEACLELAEVTGLEPAGTNSDGFREYRNTVDGSTLVFIPAGPYTRGTERGDADEKPQRTLTSSGFYIARDLVTNAQYRQFLAATGHRRPVSYAGFDAEDQPVVGVDWNDACAYAAWAGLRLPTEAEWEKAARGLDDRLYPWGDEAPIDLVEELKEKLGRRESQKRMAAGWGARATAPIGSYPAGNSPFGCRDLCGHVWQWCSDWYDAAYYAGCPETDPPGPEKGNERVCRGGCWSLRVVTLAQVWALAREPGVFKRETWRLHLPRLTVTTRGWYVPTYRFNNLGFRVARSHP
ncbi:MAG: SUMF1/EgtB/PvdO family nonheme iron enzyme [Candidatus Riflebacteria bacterium]|nr:SUMF1/EgtB/PvdO family nonheme iron enzyme [Candidatus Riflebacteria bacterium]